MLPGECQECGLEVSSKAACAGKGGKVSLGVEQVRLRRSEIPMGNF